MKQTLSFSEEKINKGFETLDNEICIIFSPNESFFVHHLISLIY